MTDDDDTTDADESAVAATTTVGSSGVTTLSTADGDTITTANGTYTVTSTDGEESSSTVLRDGDGSTVLAYTYSYTDDQVTQLGISNNYMDCSLSYQYDTEGRITDYYAILGEDEDGVYSSVRDKYTYGNKGQVIRNDHRGIEDGRGNKKTYTFSYDNRGNIRHQKQYDYTTDSLSGEAVNDDLQFSYDYDNDVWLDAVDVMGEGDDAVPIIYDANGNQVEISNVRYHWTNGRQLSAMTYIDDDGAEQPLASYTYDDNGIRTSKTYGDTTTYYTNVDGAITSQYCLDEDGAVTDLMQFIYDGSNELLGFTYNNNTYFYVKNLQGDVIAVIDSAGTEKAVYEYGAYGRLIYSDGDLADVNPMRYRGYYYDSDAGMYYLQSRYYAPEFAKFINSDLPEYAQQQKADHYGTNLFAYCCNDPVNNSDPTGNASKQPFLCERLYLWGFKHNKKNKIYDFSNKWKTKITKLLKKSTVIKRLLKSHVHHCLSYKMNSYSRTYKNVNFYKSKKNFSDIDLILSIGSGAKFKIKSKIHSINLLTKTYVFSVNIELKKEYFDFSYWTNNDALIKLTSSACPPHTKSKVVKLINNFGWCTQAYGKFVPFYFTFSVNFKYSYKVK